MPRYMLDAVRTLLLLSLLRSLGSAAFGQTAASAPAFEVASVKPSPAHRRTGLQQSTDVFAERVHSQERHAQAPGRGGLPSAVEPGIGAELGLTRTNTTSTQEQRSRHQRADGPDAAQPSCRAVQSEAAQRTARDARIRLDGRQIGPQNPPDRRRRNNHAAHAGSHFHGDMRKFADFLAVMFTMPAASSPSEPVIAGGPQIPVLDKTGLTGIFDFSVDMHPELGTDGFASWQRVLQDQLGLRYRKSQRKCSRHGCGRSGKNSD